MAHVLHGNYGRHFRQSHNPHHGGWWKFGLFAAAATAAGILFVNALWSQGLNEDLTLPRVGVTVEVAPRPMIRPPEGANIGPQQIKPPAAIEAVQEAPAAPATPAITEEARPAQPTLRVSAAPDIHGMDFATLPALQAVAQQVNGRIDITRVQYNDLTADGNDEAVVPITSDGTLGDLAFVVLTAAQGEPQPILTALGNSARQGLVVSFDGPQLTETSAVYGPFDANCCPSQIVRTYYRWDGQSLVVDHRNTITIPQGKID